MLQICSIQCINTESKKLIGLIPFVKTNANVLIVANQTEKKVLSVQNVEILIFGRNK